MKSIPNILTVLRLLACPLLIYLFEISKTSLFNPIYKWILVIFVLACLTDFFDGYLARKGNYKTNFGKFLDPIADKALILTMCGLIIVYGGKIINLGLHVIAFYIIIIRETIVSLLRFNLVDKNKSIDVSLLSKYKTFIQMLAIGGLIIIFIGLNLPLNLQIFFISFVKLLIWLSAFVTAITGVQHFKTYLKLKK